jgi:hypothetical protein
MNGDLLILILYVLFGIESGLLVFFVRWCLWRNQQLTLLLTEYYRSVINDEEE